MCQGKYFFNGKDITMNICMQIRDVINVIMKERNLTFPDAAYEFYNSKTYGVLQQTENTLWAENAEYIADRFFEESIS